MRFKKLMLVILLLLAILTISAVSASDDLATDVVGTVSDESVDLSLDDMSDESIDDFIAQKENIAVLGSDLDRGDDKFVEGSYTRDFSSIEDSLTHDNQTIELSGYYLNKGYWVGEGQERYYVEDGPIEIHQVAEYVYTLTINGNGAILDSNGVSTIIVNYGNTLVLNNITFLNSFDEFSGGPAVNGGKLIVTNCRFVNCSNMLGNGAIFSDDDCFISNCTFVNCSSGYIDGGAIGCGGNCSISNCTFVNCHSKIIGGAISLVYGSVSKCSFVNCSTGNDGGAIYLNGNGNVTNCVFRKCYSAMYGGAIELYTPDCSNVINCNFLDCHSDEGGAISSSGDNIGVLNCSFENCNSIHFGGAIKSYCSNISFVDCSFVNCSSQRDGGAIYVDVDDNIENSTLIVDRCDFVKCSAKEGGGAICLQILTSGANSSLIDSSFVNCSADEYGGGIYITIYPTLMFDCYFEGNSAKNGSDWYSEYYDIINTITKLATRIEASKVTSTYGVSKNLVAILKDVNGNVLSNKQIKLVFNGKTYYKNTASNGKVIFAVPTNLVVKSYDAKLSFAGEGKYISSAKTVTVTVKKATPKLTAKAKTFKKSVKTKKYTVTLKTNQNKVMKNTKVTLKVNGKTYSAKTNSKGVATIKITKLTKKGKFTATVKYAGSKYYNAKSVKVKITVK